MTRGRRLAAGALALAVVALPLAVLSPSLAASASDSGATSTAETKSGEGRFSDLKVTVSQTEHLRNQVIRVDWTGFKQTTELTGNFSTDYLQIMQCWDGANTADRTSCQFGGLINETRGGTAAATREVTLGGGMVDPLEPITQPDGVFDHQRVPFKSVTGKTVEGTVNEFYDQYSTNEVPFARSSASGTGTEFFEVQTSREAPGLGCGSATAGGPRSCWLVVVPRDDIEVDLRNVQDTPERRLITSPLSQSNWNNRIEFKMDFDPIGLTCPIGAAERRLVGHEEIVEAVTRWQPALCGATGSIFGYSQLSDDQARNQVASADDPWMAIVNDPINPDRLTDGRTLSYAPVGVSGIGIAVNIDRVPALDAPPSVQQKRGTKVLNLKLNPRLIAKLLTQSYNLAALERPAAMANNPLTLSEDPEFKKLNPEFADLDFLKIRQITNPLGLSDANRELWAWIGADKDARAFLNGKKDPWGAVVNPDYKGMSTDREDFPRADLGCRPGPDPEHPLCPLDALAYAADFHDAGRAAARGDNLERVTWDVNPPVQWKRNPPQLSGERQVLALVDTATAARYQLPMASLVNGAGKYVAPTTKSMTAALGGLKKTDVPGVMEVDSDYKNPAAYPLTGVSYAVTAPRKLAKDEAKAYAGLIRYVTTKGQVHGIAPGQLPDGYVPLNAALKKQAAAAATVIEKRGGPLPETPEEPNDNGGDSGPVDNGSGAPPAVSGPEPEVTTPVGTPETETVEPLSSKTPSAPAGGARFLLVAALVLGVGVAVGRPAAPLVLHLLHKRGAGAP